MVYLSYNRDFFKLLEIPFQNPMIFLSSAFLLRTYLSRRQKLFAKKDYFISILFNTTPRYWAHLYKSIIQNFIFRHIFFKI